MASRKICNTVFPLNNGWDNEAVHDEVRDSIIHAIHHGYRLIDTAQHYNVEPAVGEAVRLSGIPRSELTVITKFGSAWHHDPAQALQNSLDALGLDYVDIFLMHWPCAATPDGKQFLPIGESPTFVETWKLMETCIGPRCKAIGVSNFTQKTLDELLAVATVVPVVNQIELHAFYPNLRLVPYCHEKGIRVMGWSTMGGGIMPPGKEILTHPLFKRIAVHHECSTGVVALSWSAQRGICVIPKSSSSARIEENIKLVVLSDAEMTEIDELHVTTGRFRIAGHNQKGCGEKKPTLMGWTWEDFGWEDAEGNWLT
ncbi:hypothetical protein N7490_007272 [Penicillium lividum]|nr:hypothetical protein N7490_007272 [Penicillium lividum]